MYVTVVQMVVFYCNVSEYFSAVYYTLCNSFNTCSSVVRAHGAVLGGPGFDFLRGHSLCIALLMSCHTPGGIQFGLPHPWAGHLIMTSC
jgi:hypothetical protein